MFQSEAISIPYLIMKYITVLKLLIICVCFNQVLSDVYLHNPRGSNNRYNENSRGRRNANRLFNSENNDRGGYNVGKLYYFAGSKLQVEWTNQHSCGDQNNHCDVVLQYMCGDSVRDGTSSSTIPANPVLCENLDCNEDRRYGMHEDFFYYAHCRLRSRNRGLFTSDVRVQNSARATRQNRNSNRYGYECTEEKDYYPYWGPTPWRDIVVMTNNVSRCQMYQRESQNVKEKFACQVGRTYLYQNVVGRPADYIPISQEDCENFQYIENGVTKNGTWQRYESHGIDAPECLASQPSRDNHLGNTLGGQTMSYNWTIPDYPQENCVLRIRYNISTTEYDPDTTDWKFNRHTRNGATQGPDIWSRHGLNITQAIEKGYRHRNNAFVNVFNLDKLELLLAVDTTQMGRTFQDRSHTFSIRSRPSEIPDSVNILNLNVRGKRGNIVQVYPAVEYDYVPNTALLQADSYVHFQWTGSNNNPRNNDGQGSAGTDRSNVVMMREPTYLEGNPEVYRNNTFGQFGVSYPAHMSDSVLAGLSKEDLISLAILRQQLGGDMDELDDAGTYYDLGPRKVTRAGTYHYMCTRNNNFSNRSQKGKMMVTNSAFVQQYVDQNGGMVTLESAADSGSTSVHIPPQALASPRSIEVWELADGDSDHLPTPPNTDFVSKIVFVSPEEDLTTLDNPIRVSLRLTGSLGPLYNLEVYRTTPNADGWEKVEIQEQDSNNAHVHTHRGAYYVASRSVSAGPLAGLVVGVIVAFILLVALGVYCYKHKLIFASYGGKV